MDSHDWCALNSNVQNLTTPPIDIELESIICSTHVFEKITKITMEEKESDTAGTGNTKETGNSATDRNSETGMDRLKALFTIRYICTKDMTSYPFILT